MKKQILLIFALIASFAYSASAYVIVIQGGGRNHTYNYIRITPTRCECKGTGNNNCPIKFTGVVVERRVNMEDVVNTVLRRYESGEKTGSILYNEIMPVSWVTTDKEELVITTKEDEIIFDNK